MSFTSHAFHILKDVQAFAAALVAFVAAGTTLYVQRKIAERQSSVALKIANQNRADQLQRDTKDENRRAIAFAIRLQVTFDFMCVPVDQYRNATLITLAVMSPKNEGAKDFDLDEHIIHVFENRDSIVPVFERLLTDTGDLKLLSPHIIELYYLLVADLHRLDNLLGLLKRELRKSPVQVELLSKVHETVDSVSNRLNKARDDLRAYAKTLQETSKVSE